MPSESNVKEVHTIKALFRSFKYAAQGILTAMKIGRNIKVHSFIALLVLLGAMYFQVTQVELLILLLTISMVICMEMINTAIEHTIDLLTKERHIHAKIAKDVAAGAVLVSAVTAVAIGLIIFLPYFT